MVALPEWLKWSKKDVSNISLRDLLKDLGVGKAGVSVNWQTATQFVTALACARVIAEGIAQIPLKLHKDRPDGGSDVMKGDPLYKLVNATPNEYSTSFEWRETMGLHLVFAGNSYSIIVRVRGVPVELLPLNPRDVLPKEKDGVRFYEVQVDGKQKITVQAADMLHIRGISWDGMVGLDGVKLARDAIGLGIALEEHGSQLFRNGAEPGGVLTTDANITDPEIRKALRASWNDGHQGVANAGKIALLWGGLKFQSISQQNDQAQFLETRLFQVQEVCRWARVLTIMVGHSDKSMTFASAEQIFLSHVVHTMGPWYARIEQALDRALLTEKQRDDGYFFRFNVSALMRGSHADRSAYFAKALGSGGSPAWMTQDEVRALDELNPMGGDAGKLPVLPTNVPPPDPAAAKAMLDMETEIKGMRETLSRPTQQQPINVDARTTVNQAPAAPITVNTPDVKVQNTVNTPEVKTGDVHVVAPAVTVQPADVTVNVPQQKAADVVVNVPPAEVNVNLPARKTETTVVRDKAGNIVSASQLEKDA